MTLLVVVACWAVSLPWLLTERAVELVPFLLAGAAGVILGFLAARSPIASARGWRSAAILTSISGFAVVPLSSMTAWLPMIADGPSLFSGTAVFFSFALIPTAGVRIKAAIDSVPVAARKQQDQSKSITEPTE